MKLIIAGGISFALVFLLWTSVIAQQPTKMPRLGYLSSRDPGSDAARTEAVKAGLQELGYTDGQNLKIEYRFAHGKRERFPLLAAELVRLKVDLIVVAGGTPSVQEAQKATKQIPIIMSGGGADPVEMGLFQILAQPGGNVTGVTNRTGELGGKRLELLREVAPRITSVAVLYEPANPSSVLELQEVLPSAARALKLTILPRELRTTEDFDKALSVMSIRQADSLYVSPGALMNTNRKRIVAFASRSRLAAVYGRKEYVDDGGLIYYGADLEASYRRVAYFVDRILKGAKPGDLPIEQPTKFELVIYLKTANQIGLIVPPHMLARADRVIQ